MVHLLHTAEHPNNGFGVINKHAVAESIVICTFMVLVFMYLKEAYFYVFVKKVGLFSGIFALNQN